MNFKFIILLLVFFIFLSKSNLISIFIFIFLISSIDYSHETKGKLWQDVDFLMIEFFISIEIESEGFKGNMEKSGICKLNGKISRFFPLLKISYFFNICTNYRFQRNSENTHCKKFTLFSGIEESSTQTTQLLTKKY